MIQTSVSDIDFYERKIARLENDIMIFNEELTILRNRLRTSEDYQIKFELLHKQSLSENQRLRNLEFQEKQNYTKRLKQQIERLNEEWEKKLINMEQTFTKKQEQYLLQLQKQLSELRNKNYQQKNKCKEIDLLTLRNSNLQKDLKNFEKKIESERKTAEGQRKKEVEETKLFYTKILEEKIEAMSADKNKRIEQLETMVQKLSLQARQKDIKIMAFSFKKAEVIASRPIEIQIQKLEKQLSNKDLQLQEQLQIREKEYKIHKQQVKDLKEYIKILEEKIYNHEIKNEEQLFKLKNRMIKIKEEEKVELKKQILHCEDINRKQRVILEKLLSDREASGKDDRNKLQDQVKRLKDQKKDLLVKILELKGRLSDVQGKKSVGETEKFIKSLKNFDDHEVQLGNYQNGVTFLERQLKKITLKLEKKNIEVHHLVQQVNGIKEDTDKQIMDLKEKYQEDKREYYQKINHLQEQNRTLTSKILLRDRQYSRKQAELISTINKCNAQLKAIKNINNDLQRDYNRILQSKKTIQKSYHEQRERSVTSKSEVAIAKQQRWLELEKQKNDLEVIYKEKQEQVKSQYDLEMTEIKVQLDKLKQQNVFLKQQNKYLKRQLKDKKPESQDEKQNKVIQFNKKLATVNLQLAFIESLYHSLMEAKNKEKAPEKKGENSFGIEDGDEIPPIIREIKEEQSDFDMILGLKDPEQHQSSSDGKSPTFNFNNAGENFMTMSFKPMDRH